MAGAFDGTILVITGGAQGIGLACAKELSGRGAAVALLDGDETALGAAEKALSELDCKSLMLATDLTDKRAIEGAFHRITAELGDPTVLLNNAGQSPGSGPTEFWCSDIDASDRLIQASLMSTIYCTRQVVPAMRERRSGRIINIASDSALVGDAGFVDFCGAEAAVLGFTRALAHELAPFHVMVNAVCPGAPRSPGMSPEKQEAYDRMMAGIPWAVTYLAYPLMVMVTGQTLVANGGRFFYP